MSVGQVSLCSDFQGKHQDFHWPDPLPIICYISFATPGTHSGNGECVCVCTRRSTYDLGGRGEEEVLDQNSKPLPLGANSDVGSSLVPVAAIVTHPWLDYYIFCIKWSDFLHPWRWCSLLSLKFNRELICFPMHGYPEKNLKVMGWSEQKKLDLQSKEQLSLILSPALEINCPEE